MNSYIILLIMGEWFLFKCIMKSLKLSWKEEVSDEKKMCSLKIKVSEVLLGFKDKEFDGNVLVFYKDKVSDESTSLY